MTDLEKMERRIHKNALDMEMENKFSKEVPRINGEWNLHYWLTTRYENTDVNRVWIDTQDKKELDQIFNKYVNLYLPRHNRNTVSSFLTKEIEWAKNYQSYYTDYERIPSNKTPYYILQDWIDYLDKKKNEGSEAKVNLKENLIPQNEHSKYFSNSTQQSFFEYLIENYISKEITPVKFSWIFRFMNCDVPSPNILMSQIEYRKFIISRFQITFSRVQSENNTYTDLEKGKLTRCWKDFNLNNSSE